MSNRTMPLIRHHDSAALALYSWCVPRPERQLIARVRSLAEAAKSRRTGIIKGIGDDCAVLRPPAGHELLVTTDFSLEGVHFRREWHPPESVGHRCLTRGLSDIAAMGGEPLAVFLSLALPGDLAQSWVDRFMRGLLRLAAEYRVPLAGGDTAQSPDWSAGGHHGARSRCREGRRYYGPERR